MKKIVRELTEEQLEKVDELLSKTEQNAVGEGRTMVAWLRYGEYLFSLVPADVADATHRYNVTVINGAILLVDNGEDSVYYGEDTNE